MRMICNAILVALGFAPRANAMYVCVCHGISEKRLSQAIQEGARSFEQLQSCTGVATCCGACEPCARQVLDETLDSRATAPQAA